MPVFRMRVHRRATRDLSDPGPAAAARPAAGRLAAPPAGYRGPDGAARPGAVVLLRHAQEEAAHPLLPRPRPLLPVLHVLPLRLGDLTPRGRRPAAAVRRDLGGHSHRGVSRPHQEGPGVRGDRSRRRGLRETPWIRPVGGVLGDRGGVADDERRGRGGEMEHMSRVQNNATPEGRALPDMRLMRPPPGPPLHLVGRT